MRHTTYSHMQYTMSKKYDKIGLVIKNQANSLLSLSPSIIIVMLLLTKAYLYSIDPPTMDLKFMTYMQSIVDFRNCSFIHLQVHTITCSSHYVTCTLQIIAIITSCISIIMLIRVRVIKFQKWRTIKNSLICCSQNLLTSKEL